MEDIPDDEQECANWLHKLYQEKVCFVSLKIIDYRFLEKAVYFGFASYIYFSWA